MTRPSTLSFRARLTLRWTAAFGALLAVADLGIWLSAATIGRRELDAQVRTLAATELASAVDEYRGVHLHDFDVPSLSPLEYAGKFAQLLGPDGRVRMQSPALEGGPPLVDGALKRRVLEGGRPIVSTVAAGRPGRMAVLAARKDGETYLLATGLYSDRLGSSLSRLAWLLAGVWAAGLALTAALGSFLAKSALRPIDRITQRAAAIAHGDFSARLDEPSHEDEIGRMTRLLNEMLERLHRAIEANRSFAADASHELRSPLTAMQGEIDVALKRERSPDEYRETLALLREQAVEMGKLTEDLMLLVRAQEGRRAYEVAEVGLRELLDASAVRVRQAASDRCVVLDLSEAGGFVVWADARLASRVFDNLLQNAVRYNRKGGRVAVSAGLAPDAGSALPDVVSIRISDTGHGIADAERERVFDRFYRTDPSRSRRTGGMGLGLAICREALTLLGGSVRVLDSSDSGTTFEVRLPGHASKAGV